MSRKPDESSWQYIWRNRHLAGPAGIFLVVVAAVASFFFYTPNSGSFDKAPLRVPKSTRSCPKATVTTPLRVLPASGSGAIMNIYLGDGARAYGESPPLSIQGGTLCPGSIWPMRMSQFSRTDGQALRMGQVASWARVDNSGTALTVWVLAAPHHGSPASGPGLYSGSVSLDSSVVQGALVPVRVHVPYRNVDFIFAFGFLAAFGGFIWATLIHIAIGAERKEGFLFRNLALCVAVLFAAAIPVVNVQVLAKTDWQGTLSQFIALATLIGAAAIALTPTLRALVLPKGLGADDTSKSTDDTQNTGSPQAADAAPGAAAAPAQPAAEGQPTGHGAPPGNGQPTADGQSAAPGGPAVPGEAAAGAT